MKEAESIPITTTNTRLSGKIVKLDPSGWGFIESPTDLPLVRIYFQWTALPGNVFFKELKLGQQITFEAQQIPDKGWRAIRIKTT